MCLFVCLFVCSPLSDKMTECHDFTFITGFIVFPDSLNTTTGVVDQDMAIMNAMNLISKYSPSELRGHFHGPAVSILSNSAPGNFSFCDNKCVIIALKSVDVSGSFAINTEYVSLRNGACRNSFDNPNW